MATISTNTKVHGHARSISLPSTSNQQSVFSEFYSSLDATTSCSSSSSSSSSSIADNLRAVNDMYESIQSFLILESTQRSLAQSCYKEELNKFLDGLVGLLDLCTITKDIFSMCMNSVIELQSNLRRKRGDKHGLTTSVEEYLEKRRKLKKIIAKSLSSLQKQHSSSVNEDNRTITNISKLKEMKIKTVALFEAILTFFIGSRSQTKAKGWFFVSKMIGNKNAECDQSQEESEVKKMDDQLQTLIRYKEAKTCGLEVKTIQMGLTDLERNLLDLEEQVDCLCRHLIKTRVSILNIMNF